MLARGVLTAGRKAFAVRNVRGLRQLIASFVRDVMTTVQSSSRKSARQDGECPMFAMAASRLTNAV
jgi:hypothetical protein